MPYQVLLVEVQVGRSCGGTLDSNFGQSGHRKGTAFGFSSFLCKLVPLPVLRELFLSDLSSLKSSAKKWFSHKTDFSVGKQLVRGTAFLHRSKKFFVFCFARKVKCRYFRMFNPSILFVVVFPSPLRLAYKATWCYTFIHHFIEYIILRMLKIGTSLSRKS